MGATALREAMAASRTLKKLELINNPVNVDLTACTPENNNTCRGWR